MIERTYSRNRAVAMILH